MLQFKTKPPLAAGMQTPPCSHSTHTQKCSLSLSLSNDNENWWQAQHADTKEVGWIPSNYVAPMQSLDNEPWYHGRVRGTYSHTRSCGVSCRRAW